MSNRLAAFRSCCIFICFICFSWIRIVASSDSTRDWEEYYLDVQPANTSWHLTAIRALPLRHYRLGDDDKIRIGIIGPEVAQFFPDAVELIHKRPGDRRGGFRNIDSTDDGGFPTVNEHTLFMYGVGATKELAKQMEHLSQFMKEQKERIMRLYETAKDLEKAFNQSRDNSAELRIKGALQRAEISRMEMNIALQRAENTREYLEQQKQAELAQIELNEKLTLELLEKEQEASRKRTEEAMLLKFEASQKVEKARLEAAEELSKMEHEKNIALQKATEEMKIQTAKAIAEANAEAERANEDVRLRKLRAEAEQRRERNMAIINSLSHQISVAFTAAVKNPKKAFMFIAYISSLALAFHVAREAAKLCRSLIESTIGKPKLLRETSRKSMMIEIIQSLIHGISIFLYDRKTMDDLARQSCEEVFDDVILPPQLKDRVISLAKSARKVREHKAPHRHVLFYGPPGTGKTMVARKLAKCIGMDYALMSGGDVGPLGSDAVTQIHNLFTWSKLSRKGVLLFIDEAEAFLANRNKSNMSEMTHNALNALLYHTGGERRDFMLVLATNRAEDLDSAVLDRCDESLLFPLPDEECRYHLITRYFDYYVRRVERRLPSQKHSLFVSIRNRLWKKSESNEKIVDDDVMDAAQIRQTVKETSGFSGREIGKLMIAMQGAIRSSQTGRLSRLHCQEIIDAKVDEHKEKMKMKQLH